ncbi:MAG: YjbH domain-containing protein [Roseovarius sp.]|nr:YjbH domain-containing protein [Roseovarius sp.]
MFANDLTTTVTNNFGTPGGLVDMPTAEMAPDAQLSTTVSYFDGTTKTTLSFQVLPWLSTSFRYSAIKGLVAEPGRPPISTFYDRSFDLKFRLLKETDLRPSLSVGLRDFVGTGLFGGEYIVASKSIGDRLRVTGGLGWGRLGSYGSFGSTGTRKTNLLGEGGIPNYDRWFRGDVAPFAGASFAVTDRLNVKLEYSSDGYDREVTDGIIRHRSPFNFGADYKLGENFRLNAFYLHGDEVGVNLTASINLREPAVKGGIETAPLPVALRAPAARSDLGWTADDTRKANVRSAVEAGLNNDGLALHGMSLQGQSAHVMIRNARFDMNPQAVGRTARLLSRTLPASVEVMTITQVVEGVPTSSVTLRRSDLERLENAPASEILAAAQFNDALAVGQPVQLSEDPFSRFSWSLGPFLRFSVFDPENPVRLNAGVQLKGDYRIAPGWVASASVSQTLLGNLDQVRLPQPSGLPRVRSNVALYSRTNDPTVDYLTLSKYGRLGRDFYTRGTVGYLEKMYAGASAEVLWKPVSSRLGLGAEVNYVRPRDFDQLFGLRSRTGPGGTIPEFNGHASVYYDFGNGFHAQLDGGRYLAGDWGSTLSIDREYANGWKVGVFATKTDVSSATFGEGSFDKGIRIQVPIAWGIGKPSKTTSNTVIRSLSRDGGARLEVNGRLYESIRNTHQPEMAKTWGKFWR